VSAGSVSGDKIVSPQNNTAYVLAKGEVEYVRTPHISAMKSAIRDEVGRGRITEDNVEQWRLWAEDYSDGLLFCRRALKFSEAVFLGTQWFKVLAPDNLRERR
jgi:hypothetical protein